MKSEIPIFRPLRLVYVMAVLTGCEAQIPTPAVVYTLPGMDAVTVKKDIDYKADSALPLKMDVYTPAEKPPAAGYPTVILIHGGAKAAARVKDTRAFTSWGRLLAVSGVAAVTFNWDYPRSADVDDLIRFVRENAAQWKLDKDRLCLFAFSAGAAESIRAGLHNTPAYVRCIVSYYGSLRSVERELEHEPVDRLAPILIARAGRDALVAGKEIDGFVTAGRSKSMDITLLEHPAGVHAFDLRNDDDQSRTIIKQTLAFIRKHLTSAGRPDP